MTAFQLSAIPKAQSSTVCSRPSNVFQVCCSVTTSLIAWEKADAAGLSLQNVQNAIQGKDDLLDIGIDI